MTDSVELVNSTKLAKSLFAVWYKRHAESRGVAVDGDCIELARGVFNTISKQVLKEAIARVDQNGERRTVLEEDIYAIVEESPLFSGIQRGKVPANVTAEGTRDKISAPAPFVMHKELLQDTEELGDKSTSVTLMDGMPFEIHGAFVAQHHREHHPEVCSLNAYVSDHTNGAIECSEGPHKRRKGPM